MADYLGLGFPLHPFLLILGELTGVRATRSTGSPYKQSKMYAFCFSSVETGCKWLQVYKTLQQFLQTCFCIPNTYTAEFK